MATKYEEYDTSEADLDGMSGTSEKVAQTFTPQTTHAIIYVVLALSGSGADTGNVTVEIRTTSDGEPTDVILCSKTFDGATELGDGSWTDYTVTFTTSVILDAGVTYAIVIYSTGTGAWNWRCNSSGTYSRGKVYLDLGSGWMERATYDCDFQDWGDALSIPVDVVTYKRLVAVGNNEFWYEDI